MKTYAFVFARGGSKGLPEKNIRPLGGVPLIGHSILLARQVAAIGRVFVSTDNGRIARIAREHGAEVIERPAELATDTAAEWLAWQHAIRHVRASGDDFDRFISLPATSPLRAVQDVVSCLDMLEQDADIVITVTPAARSPYFNMVTRAADGGSAIVLGSAGISRRQDAPVVFDITTVAYAARPDYILTSDKAFAGRVKSVIVPKERAVDIDDEIDFLLAEAIHARRAT